jgi:hypothetical protein
LNLHSFVAQDFESLMSTISPPRLFTFQLYIKNLFVCFDFSSPKMYCTVHWSSCSKPWLSMQNPSHLYMLHTVTKDVLMFWAEVQPNWQFKWISNFSWEFTKSLHNNITAFVQWLRVGKRPELMRDCSVWDKPRDCGMNRQLLLIHLSQTMKIRNYPQHACWSHDSSQTVIMEMLSESDHQDMQYKHRGLSNLNPLFPV